MAFVKDDGVTFIYPYTFRMLREDNPSTSFPRSIMEDPADLVTLESLDVFPVVDNPPPFDPTTQRLVPGVVTFVDPDYVLGYTTPDLSADEIDDIESRQADWTRIVRRSLNNNNGNSPYRQMQAWALELGKGRYNNHLHDWGLVMNFRKVRQFRNMLTALKADLGTDSFTNPQITEIDRLIGFLGVNWTWADL